MAGSRGGAAESLWGGYDPEDIFILTVGRKGSGIPWHFHVEGWSALLCGEKTWSFAPAGVAPGGGFDSSVGHSAWLDLEAAGSLGDTAWVWSCLQEAGDTVFIPEGWYHATVTNSKRSFAVGRQDWGLRRPFRGGSAQPEAGSARPGWYRAFDRCAVADAGAASRGDWEAAGALCAEAAAQNPGEALVAMARARTALGGAPEPDHDRARASLGFLLEALALNPMSVDAAQVRWSSPWPFLVLGGMLCRLVHECAHFLLFFTLF